MIVHESDVFPPSRLNWDLPFLRCVYLDLSLRLHGSFRMCLFLHPNLGLSPCLAQNVVIEPIDDVLDSLMFEDHLLMVAVALGWGSGFHSAAYENIDLYVFSLLCG